MTYRVYLRALLALLGMICLNADAWAALSPPAEIQAAYGRLPLSFEANQGQTADEVKFLSRGPGYSLFLTPGEAVLALRKAQSPSPSGEGAARTKSVGGMENGIPLPPGEGRVRGSEKDFFPGNLLPTNRAMEEKGMKSHFISPHPNPLPEGEGVNPPLANVLPDSAPPQGAVLRMRLAGAREPARIVGRDRQPGTVNYFKGRDPGQWRTGVATYGKVEYQGVYPGVDLVYYGNQRQLEYDFIVAPGADPNQIRLSFSQDGQTAAPRLDGNGDLLLPTGADEVRLHKPVVYQEIEGKRREIEGQFVVLPAMTEGKGERQVGFQVAEYDRGRPLVIDPVLVYSTYLGGSDKDVSQSIAVDSVGNAYVTGVSYSTDFPSINAKYPQLWGSTDAFITKLRSDGKAVIYSTYLGGSGSENRCADSDGSVAVDSIGNAYLVGSTGSSDFPISNAKYPQLRGAQDVFVAKLSADGQRLLYSTYLGGGGWDCGSDIAVDSAGNAYVTGHIFGSHDFPTVNAKYPNFGGYVDTFVTKFNTSGTQVLYSTYLGGTGEEIGYGIAVDSSRNIYVVGRTWSTDFPVVNAKYPQFRGERDAFVTKFSANGQTVIYSTYLGGNGLEIGKRVTVDGFGNAYVLGLTKSADFPTINAKYQQLRGEYDAFITKFSTNGQQVFYSTYFGGSSKDFGSDIAVDSAGNTYVTGVTFSTDFPIVNAKYPHLWGPTDAFFTKFTADGQRIIYSTYLGGSGAEEGNGIAVDTAGNAYVTGSTSSTDFPTSTTDPKIVSYDPTYNGDGDAFVAKLSSSNLALTPTSQDFGLVTPGRTRDRSFTVKNLGSATLTGTVSTTAPFSVVSGGSFSLAAGASQKVVVRFAPTAQGLFNQPLKAIGNFATVSVPLKGITAAPLADPPVIDSTSLKGPPGGEVTISGRYFGPMWGQVTVNGNAAPIRAWNDTSIRFVVPKLDPGSYPVVVKTALGQAGATLAILSTQPAISALRPGNGAPGATVVIDGYNFGAQQGTGTLKVGGVNAPVLSWSNQRVSFTIPSLATGVRYPLVLQTPAGTATGSLLVRNLFLIPQYGECDAGRLAACPAVILSVTNQSADGKTADILLENLYDRWYELKITPTGGATVPGSRSRLIGPKQKLTISGVGFVPGSNVLFFADATSNRGMTAVALDLLHIAATGSHLPTSAMGIALSQFQAQAPSSKLVVFIVELMNNLAEGDAWAIVDQIVHLPDLADDPVVQYFLINYLGLSLDQIEKLGFWSQWAYVGSVVTKMVEQLLLPDYAASSLVAK
jgi:hypothetical protein